jgi:hypothetical protein
MFLILSFLLAHRFNRALRLSIESLAASRGTRAQAIEGPSLSNDVV